MGLSNLRFVRGANESRNGDRPIVGDKTASIGQAVLDLVALVVAEMQRRDENLNKTSESVAADKKDSEKKGGES